MLVGQVWAWPDAQPTFTRCRPSRTLQTGVLRSVHAQKTEPPRVGGATDPPFHRRRAPPRLARPYMSPACSLLSPHGPRRILPLLLPLRLSSSAVSAPAFAMPRRDGVRFLLLPSPPLNSINPLDPNPTSLSISCRLSRRRVNRSRRLPTSPTRPLPPPRPRSPSPSGR